jgi:hypothetical protein
MSEQQRQPGRIDREMPARLTPAQPIPDAGGKEVVQAAATGESPSLAAKERQRALTARLMEQVTCEPGPQIRAVEPLKETAGYDKYVRWCGRTGAARPPPTRFAWSVVNCPWSVVSGLCRCYRFTTTDNNGQMTTGH